MLLMIPLATLVDVPIARWLLTQPLPYALTQALQISVYYSQGTGVFLVLTLFILLKPRQRWCVPRLATLAMGAGAVSTLTKMFVLRPRPSSLYLDSANLDYAWIWSFDWTLSQVANFDAATRAFPSASLATATALTAGLWVLSRRTRWIFLVLCVGTMLQRAYCGAHFASDLFGSASVGLGWAYACFHPSLMGGLFDKMESVDSRAKTIPFPSTTGAENGEDATPMSDTMRIRRKLEMQAKSSESTIDSDRRAA